MSSRLYHSHIAIVCVMLSSFAWMNACSEDKDKQEPQPPLFLKSDLMPLSLQSEDACLIDGDCVMGAFCFNGQCATQCENDDDSAGDYVCSVRNGRCITKEFADNMYLTDEEDGSLPSTRKLRELTDLNAQDLAEAKASNVVESIPGFEILTPPKARSMSEQVRPLRRSS